MIRRYVRILSVMGLLGISMLLNSDTIVLGSSNSQSPTKIDRVALASQLTSKVDALKQAIANGEYDRSVELHTDISHLLVLWAPSPADRLSVLENSTAGASVANRMRSLPRLAKLSLRAGHMEQAALYVNEMRNYMSDPADLGSMHGDFVHDANMIDGLLSLNRDDVERAKSLLLAAGQTEGSPVLDTFGPSMALAKALAEKGETETVVAYLQECQRFWKGGHARLSQWIATLKGGATPEFASKANL